MKSFIVNCISVIVIIIIIVMLSINKPFTNTSLIK